jgi:tRNA-specific 2-thiouridylase
VADKKDSQEICFVTSGQHAQFIRDKTGISQPGEIVTEDGRVVGTHAGIEGFTIGQRKGIGVAMGSPYFVTAIDSEKRQVVIGPHESLARKSLIAIDSNWLTEDLPYDEPFEAEVQIRYNSEPQPAKVQRSRDGRFEVRFKESTFGVSPGQLAAVFRGTRALGCGWIHSTQK